MLPLAIVGGLVFGSLGALAAIGAVVAIVHCELLTATVALGMSVFCLGLIVPLFTVVPGRTTPRCAFDESGTTIRPDRRIDVPIQMSLLGLTVASGLFAMLGPLGKLDVPVPTEMRISLPVAAAITAVTSAPILFRILLRGSTKYLRVAPVGFEFAQGWQSHRGDWTEVADITDVAPGQSTETKGAIVIVMSDGTALTFAAGSCTPGGRALREFLRFYWQRPNRRDELLDRRASQHLNDVDFRGDA
jgi:hypothetical protein